MGNILRRKRGLNMLRSKSFMTMKGVFFKAPNKSRDYSLNYNTWIRLVPVDSTFRVFYIKMGQSQEIFKAICYNEPQVSNLDKDQHYAIYSHKNSEKGILTTIFICKENEVINTIKCLGIVKAIKIDANNPNLLVIENDKKEIVLIPKYPLEKVKKIEFNLKSGQTLHASKKGITWSVAELKGFSCYGKPNFLDLEDDRFIIYCDKDEGTRIAYFQNNQLKEEFNYNVKVRIEKVKNDFAVIYDDEREEFPLSKNRLKAIPIEDKPPTKEIELEGLFRLA